MDSGGGALIEVRPYLMRAMIESRVFARVADQAAVALEVAMLQLENPAASGVVAVVWQVFTTAEVAITYQARLGIAQAVTDVGTGFNLRAGAAASVCHVRRDTEVSIGGNTIALVINDALLTVSLEMLPIAILPADQRLTIVTTQVNVQGLVSFVWEEISAL